MTNRKRIYNKAINRRDLKFVLDILQENIIDDTNVDWYSVMGFLELNRIAIPFYNCSKRMGIELPPTIKRKFINTLTYQQSRNNIMSDWVNKLSGKICMEKVPHAFLKGSVLSNCGFSISEQYKNLNSATLTSAMTLYKCGERISNDIDILINQKDISKVGELLFAIGFKQGYWDFNNNKFVELSRSEIISRRMNRGETAPFILQLDNGVIPFVEVDINFSLDHLPGGEYIADFLADGKKYDSKICGLEETKFFLHLLMHQYKESIVYSMVQRGKDLELYKYFDIYLMIKNKIVDFDKLYVLVKDLRLERECYYVMLSASEIFGNLKDDNTFKKFMESIKPQNTDYINEVVDPENNNKKYYWHESVLERLAVFDRLCYLADYKEEELMCGLSGDENNPCAIRCSKMENTIISKFTKAE